MIVIFQRRLSLASHLSSWLIFWPLLILISLTGCGSTDQPGDAHRASDPPFARSLPFGQSVFRIGVADVDRDSRRDVFLVNHGDGLVQTFYQVSSREFLPGASTTPFGFHPGDLNWLLPEQSLMVEFAEGAGKILVYRLQNDGSFTVLSARQETAPRHGDVFRWPGWGMGLAVVPYVQGYLVLLKNVDPNAIDRAERILVPLDKDVTLRTAERLVVRDIDNDGVDEILFATVNTNEVAMIRAPAKGKKMPRGEIIASFPSGRPRNVVAADWNEDGHVDLLVPNQSEPFLVHLLVNDGKGRFAEANTIAVPTQQGISRLAAERDADGHLYVLVVAIDGLHLYQIPRAWTADGAVPSRSLVVQPPRSTKDALLSDIDGDGWLDALYENRVLFGPLWEHFGQYNGQPISSK